MCWSGEASAAIAVIGFGSSAYFYVKFETKVYAAILGYFSLMEVLQAYSYSVIGQCSNPDNQTVTLLSYLHLAFHPFFFNAMALYYVPESVRKKISAGVYIICFAACILFLLRLYPINWGYFCTRFTMPMPFFEGRMLDMPFCGDKLCTVAGEWHLAWQAPIYETFPPMGMAYWVASFMLPALYGSWKITVFQVVMGPMLAMFTTSNANEWIAIWCMYSVLLILVALVTPLRESFHVKRWVWWPLLGSR